ncbi:MAG: PilZ domain-containing protein [Pseudomonadales bacterium]
MDHKLSPQSIINERRNYYRIEDKVLLRYQAIDESSALANIAPPQFGNNLAHSLMRDLEHIDQENNKYLRSIAETNRELEIYLKAISKKIDTIATRLVETTAPAPDLLSQVISLSEGGLAFRSGVEQANDGYLALQLTLLPSAISLLLFAKVINCSPLQAEPSTHPVESTDGFTIAVSFVNLQDSDRQMIAKHIITLQLLERRQHSGIIKT